MHYQMNVQWLKKSLHYLYYGRKYKPQEQNKKLKVENNQKYSENLPPKTNKYSKFQVSTNVVQFFHFKRICNPDFDIVKFIWRFDWG
jgi:hypothetical protein